MYDHIMLQAYYFKPATLSLYFKPETLNQLSYSRGETQCSCHVHKGQLIIRCLNVLDNIFFNLSHSIVLAIFKTILLYMSLKKTLGLLWTWIKYIICTSSSYPINFHVDLAKIPQAQQTQSWLRI